MRTESPTSINTFLKCPRLYYYRYILKIPIEPNIHLYKGSLIHSILEDVFKNTKYINLLTETKNLIEKRWKVDFKIDKKEELLHKKEALLMLKNFSFMFENRLRLLLLEEKIKDKNHAWNFLKPKMKELEIVDNDLNFKGIIDVVEKDFNDRIFIIDYKTSKKFKDMIPEEYVRQVSFYAMLFFRKYKILPDYVGINYLRYGEICYLPVNTDMIKESERIIAFVRKNTVSKNIEDYPLVGDKFAIEECKKIEEKLK